MVPKSPHVLRKNTHIEHDSESSHTAGAAVGERLHTPGQNTHIGHDSEPSHTAGAVKFMAEEEVIIIKICKQKEVDCAPPLKCHHFTFGVQPILHRQVHLVSTFPY